MLRLFMASSISCGMSIAAGSRPQRAQRRRQVAVAAERAHRLDPAPRRLGRARARATSSPSASAISPSFASQPGRMRSSPGGRKIALATPCGHAVVRGHGRRGGVHDRVRVHVERDARHAARERDLRDRRRGRARARPCAGSAPIMRIARMLIESSSGSLPRLRYDSVACASASAPVAAMIALGAVSTSSGSTIATVAARLRDAHTTLKCSSGIGDHDDERDLGARAAGRRDADHGRPVARHEVAPAVVPDAAAVLDQRRGGLGGVERAAAAEPDDAVAALRPVERGDLVEIRRRRVLRGLRVEVDGDARGVRELAHAVDRPGAEQALVRDEHDASAGRARRGASGRPAIAPAP